MFLRFDGGRGRRSCAHVGSVMCDWRKGKALLSFSLTRIHPIKQARLSSHVHILDGCCQTTSLYNYEQPHHLFGLCRTNRCRSDLNNKSLKSIFYPLDIWHNLIMIWLCNQVTYHIIYNVNKKYQLILGVTVIIFH